MQRPDPILNREHQRSLVAIGGGRGLLADDQKSREIMRGILYFPRNHFKFIKTGSEFARDGRRRWFLGSQLGGCGSAGGLIKRDTGEVHPEPSPRLGEGMRMRVYPLDLPEIARFRQEA